MHLTPVLIIGISIAGVYGITRSVLQYRLRRQMIALGHVEPEKQSVLSDVQRKSNHLDALKWGLVMVGGGLGLIMDNLFFQGLDLSMPPGFSLTGAGIGFICYYIIARFELRGEENNLPLRESERPIAALDLREAQKLNND